MSKGVVVQLENDSAHVMMSDGAFVSCRRDFGWQVGDVITIRQKRRGIKYAISVSAVFFGLLLGSGVYMYFSPATYLEITVNPSVRLTANRFDRILDAVGLNKEGEMQIQDTDYKNLTLDEAYSRLLNRLENNGYLYDSYVRIIIACDSYKKIDKVEQKLKDLSQKYLDSNNIGISVKRYATAEYLSMPHPLPVIQNPGDTSENAASAGSSAVTENLPEAALNESNADETNAEEPFIAEHETGDSHHETSNNRETEHQDDKSRH